MQRIGRMWKVVVVGVLALGGLTAGVPAAQAGLPVKTLTCGQWVSESVKLAADMHCPGGDGLRINADIVLDLGGHTITGSGVGDGVYVANGKATVRNGTIQSFSAGIRTSQPGLVRNVLALKNQIGFVVINAPEPARFERSDALQNVERGYAIQNSPGISITDATVMGSKVGIYVMQANDTVVRGNLLDGNKEGIVLTDGAGNRIRKNTIRSSGLDGLSLSNITASRIARNVSEENRRGVWINGTGNKIGRNTIVHNDEHGIYMSGGSGNTIKRNTVNVNGFDGIFSAVGAITITDNVAKHNGWGDNGIESDLGIESGPGTVGSGNIAKHNENPKQCTPDHLC